MYGSQGCTAAHLHPASWLGAHWVSPPPPVIVVQVCVDRRFAPALALCCRTGWEGEGEGGAELWLPKLGIGAVSLPEIQLGSTHCLQRKA